MNKVDQILSNSESYLRGKYDISQTMQKIQPKKFINENYNKILYEYDSYLKHKQYDIFLILIKLILGCILISIIIISILNIVFINKHIAEKPLTNIYNKPYVDQRDLLYIFIIFVSLITFLYFIIEIYFKTFDK